MKEITASKRLIFRELIEKDVEDIYELDSDPEVHRYLGNHPIESREEALDIILHVRKQYKDKGVGRWAMVHKISGECIGWCGFKVESRNWKSGEYYDLGYRLKQKHWRKGYGFEAANCCLKYGFQQMELNEICAAADIDHKGSNRIIQKLGLQWVKTFEYDQSVQNWYELEKKDWINQQEITINH
ncbi:MAG TPA: GNAT family N-acetyltransferase [Saprospiraceae bacterium]|nr:GNAT family N-acetyltransferase [Saprospiraceae bacterium]